MSIFRLARYSKHPIRKTAVPIQSERVRLFHCFYVRQLWHSPLTMGILQAAAGTAFISPPGRTNRAGQGSPLSAGGREKVSLAPAWIVADRMPFLSLKLPLVRSESIGAFVVAAGSCRSSCRFCTCNMVDLIFKVQVVIADYNDIIIFCGYLRNTVVRTVSYRYSVCRRKIYRYMEPAPAILTGAGSI